jgi:uncharacterized protein
MAPSPAGHPPTRRRCGCGTKSGPGWPISAGRRRPPVAWDLPGFRHLTGKADFEGEIVNPQFEGNPTLVVDRKVEEGDTVVCIGDGHGQMKTGDEFRFAFCDVFTFRDDLICRVESYIVPLAGPSIADLAEG